MFQKYKLFEGIGILFHSNMYANLNRSVLLFHFYYNPNDIRRIEPIMTMRVDNWIWLRSFGSLIKKWLLTYWHFSTKIKNNETWFQNGCFVVLYDFITALSGLKNRLSILPKVVEWRKSFHEILIYFQKLGGSFHQTASVPCMRIHTHIWSYFPIKYLFR